MYILIMKFIRGISMPSYFIFTLFLFPHLTKSKSLFVTSTFIVYMDNSLMPIVFTSPQNWYSCIIDSLKFETFTSLTQHQPLPYILYIYKHAMHGFSVVLSLDQLKALRKHQGFISATHDNITTFTTTYTPKFLSLVHSTGLWSTSNYGQGIIIGIIDSGVWPEHPSFQDHGMSAKDIPNKWNGSCEQGQDFNILLCNLKLVGAKFFNKGLLSSNENLKISMNSAKDTISHGTFVSTIAAGNYVDEVSYFGYGGGTSSGVAPRAMLAMYKVIWDDRKIHYADIVAAIDEAIKDGVDVINISLHDYGLPFFENPMAIASFSAMQKDIIVSCAAGNEGPGIVTMHNGIPWVITVAAGSTDRWFAGTLTLEGGIRIIGWSTFPGTVSVQDVPLFYDETLSECKSSELLSKLSHKIIICKEASNITEQISAISSSNIQGAILIGDEVSMSDTPCFCIKIKSKDALVLLEYVRSRHKPLATIEFQQTIMGVKPAPTVPSFSSRGPSRSGSNILKPDIMAPGVYVIAGWTPNQPVAHLGALPLYDRYALTSGTSGASAHVSGIAALLKSAHKNWSHAAIRSAIMTTANPLDNTGNPIQTDGKVHRPASPLDMGAGYVDPNQALDPGLIYDATEQDYVNLLCSLDFDRDQMHKIVRSNDYDCSKPSSDLNYPSFIALYNVMEVGVLKEKLFQRILTNVGNDSTTYNATVIAPGNSEVIVSPNTLVFGKSYEKKSYTLTIKYTGLQPLSYGSLEWVENNGPHTVRSPIVVTLDLKMPYWVD